MEVKSTKVNRDLNPIVKIYNKTTKAELDCTEASILDFPNVIEKG